MISYTLKCEAGHSFDSWFQSAAAFEKLVAARQVTCVECGSHGVTKAVMAPRLSKGPQTSAPDQQTPEVADTPMLSAPDTEMQQALAELRRKVEANSDYVGDRFAREARAMHLGEKPARSIYGEARLDQARSLIEDGVPLMPLPFRPKQKLS
ncbi:hypothetical protein A8B82_20095 [Sulfitobacter sp. EhC04]|uniref:DUF1178 family protein n=1 Tax=Sulfitobacter sp. EhC04 TaxID=1849168 RepID=UPI0007F4C79F|nr:DUF1178 family protein [Sulfitobacter sp. EhC04]OAN72321.1 hypothetical protein A8B82_20095 [Sulfitobacter sp. EhC04]